ncbi:MAG: hypothetical protein P0120_09030 [Nitrospira sp.]|nr:hypothetical protein [Nitrospira sp.]
MSLRRIKPYLDAMLLGMLGHLTVGEKYGPLRVPLNIVLERLAHPSCHHLVTWRTAVALVGHVTNEPYWYSQPRAGIPGPSSHAAVRWHRTGLVLAHAG